MWVKRIREYTEQEKEEEVNEVKKDLNELEEVIGQQKMKIWLVKIRDTIQTRCTGLLNEVKEVFSGDTKVQNIIIVVGSAVLSIVWVVGVISLYSDNTLAEEHQDTPWVIEHLPKKLIPPKPDSKPWSVDHKEVISSPEITNLPPRAKKVTPDPKDINTKKIPTSHALSSPGTLGLDGSPASMNALTEALRAFNWDSTNPWVKK